MFGVLLESRAKRQRRTGGAALSVAAHLTIVGAVTAFAVPRPVAKPDKPESVAVVITNRPEEPRAEIRRAEPALRRSGPFNAPFEVRLPVPTISDHLPPIVSPQGPPLDSLLLLPGRSGGSSDARGRLGRLDVGSDTVATSEWRGTEVLMHVVTQAKPRYPDNLRQAAIEGRVLVQFSVDTLGRVDPASVTIISSTHELFTRAVRDALGGFRFRPAEVNGRRVRALAQMPFEFSIQR
jgi:TonB family protein